MDADVEGPVDREGDAAGVLGVAFVIGLFASFLGHVAGQKRNDAGGAVGGAIVDGAGALGRRFFLKLDDSTVG
jgi:uncharacterized membrane protein